jgi:ParB-like chromosome segregation protein Spo0J
MCVELYKAGSAIRERAAVSPFSGPFRIAVSDLGRDLSPRSSRVDDDHVRALVEVIDRVPPVIVDQQCRLIDGVHRVEAFRRLGRTHIDVIRFDGSETESIVLAVEANVKHGRPLSMAERRAAAAGLLRRCPERSDRWLGSVCGLSHSTIAVLRRDVEVAPVERRVGRDGRLRPVDQKPGRVAVEQAIAHAPGASLRELAGRAGVSVSTARRIALRGGRPAGWPASKRATTDDATKVLDLKDTVFDTRPELMDTKEWLARTSVDLSDLTAHLEALPLSRVYEVVDECRRRSEVWGEMARILESKVPGRKAASA